MVTSMEKMNLGELFTNHPELKSVFLKYGIPVAG